MSTLRARPQLTRPRLPWLPLLALATAIALIIAAAVATRPDAARPDAATNATPTSSSEPASEAPPAEVQRLHRALHDLGSQCEGPAPKRSQPAIDRDAAVILTFARRYPQGRFPIDDETGSALSLLLVTRDTLRTCDPDLAVRANLALPAEFQEPRQRR